MQKPVYDWSLLAVVALKDLPSVTQDFLLLRSNWNTSSVEHNKKRCSSLLKPKPNPRFSGSLAGWTLQTQTADSVKPVVLLQETVSRF